MSEYHRDKERMLSECEKCPYNLTICDRIVLVLGSDLKESGVMPDADPTKFYFADPCPMRVSIRHLEVEE